MPVRHQEPIVAIATAPGRGAVGIVRVSGRNLSSLIQALLAGAAAATIDHVEFRSLQGSTPSEVRDAPVVEAAKEDRTPEPPTPEGRSR